LKILVLSHRVPFPPNKGEKLRTYHQLERLKQLGHSVSVISPSNDFKDEGYAATLASDLEITVKTAQLEYKPLRFVKALATKRSLSEANFYSSSVKQLIKNEIQSFEPDFLFLTASSLIRYLDSIANANNGPIILTDFMDVDSNKWQQYQHKARFPMNLIYEREAKLVKKLEIEAANISKECYLIASAEVELFKKEVTQQGNITILPNGIDSSIFKPNIDMSKPAHPTLLFTGVMDYEPNIDAILWFIANCWSQIKEQYPNSKLVIAGMNPSNNIKKLGIRDDIVVTGFVEDIMPYFQNACIFVAPFQIARGVQNKVLQAMSCELPVVTTSKGIEGIIHCAGKDVVLADTADQYTRHCLNLLESIELRESIGKAARQTILANYAWPEVLKPLTSRIEKAI
jgi:sugar transferase (PEP-CTERM/EpsH1 system associated)